MLLPTIYLAGDSTVQTYKKEAYPQMGWGQKLSDFISCPIVNHAMAARSSKTFIEEGRLSSILENIRQGDYLILQFGHNDANVSKPERYLPPEDFPSYLMHYIRGAREKRAQSILVTPIAQRILGNNGFFEPSFPLYRNAMITLAQRESLPMIDLGLLSSNHLNTLTQEESKKLYMPDDSHLQEYGAYVYASFVVQELIKVDHDISAYCSLKNR